jgi:hypothetical protein
MKYFIITLIGVGLILLFGCQDNIVQPKTQLDYSLKQANKGENINFGFYENQQIDVKFGGIVLYFNGSINLIINNELVRYSQPKIQIKYKNIILTFEVKFISIDDNGNNDVISIQLLHIKV